MMFQTPIDDGPGQHNMEYVGYDLGIPKDQLTIAIQKKLTNMLGHTRAII